MLSVLTAHIPTLAEEPQDRDPGLLTFVFSLVRALRRGAAGAFGRRCDLARGTGPNA